MTSGGALLLFTIGVLQAHTSPTETDLPTWMHCTLPENEYIGVHAETRKNAEAPWRSVVGHLQPFRSMTNRAWQQVYFRKDDPSDYYGEFFTYDDAFVRLHTETFPPPTHLDPEDGPDWHDRPDRLRLFVDTKDNDWKLGRVIGPTRLVQHWEYRATVNTYLADTFAAITERTAPRYQTGVRDHVTITFAAPFSTVYDGVAEDWPADPEFTTFDEAVIVNQHMNDNAARERFIFARKGAVFYGIVRWDESYLVDGNWEVRARTTALRRIKQDTPFSFDGMIERARKLDMVPSTSAPALIE